MVMAIAGLHRSGTSILTYLCNSHPEIILTNELGSLMVLGQPFPAYRKYLLKRWWDKRNATLFERSDVKGINMLKNLAYVTRFLGRVQRRKQGNVTGKEIDLAMKDLFPQARVVGDKYPDYMFRLPQLTADEAVRVVFIYRDPRDVASSTVKKARHEWSNDWPAELREAKNIAQRWTQTIHQMEKVSSQVLSIRYEALVTEPGPVLECLGNWLNVDAAGFNKHLIRKDSVGKHAHGLTEPEIAEVIAIAGPTMQRLGYEL